MNIALKSGADRSRGALERSVQIWFAIAAAGQIAFFIYIAGLYGVATATGAWSRWNAIMHHGLVSGDGTGNASLIVHVLLAGVLTFGGLMQLTPAIRARWPRLHRWNGRVYLVTACIVALTGLYLTWARPPFGGTGAGLSITGNAAAILICGALAWRAARAGDFEVHWRWAVRLFLVVSGVWFMRVFMMSWALSTGAAGMTNAFNGPADRAIQLGSYLLPLAVFQIYLMARESNARARWAAVVLMGIACVVTLAGSALAAAFMWLPRI